MKIPSTNDPIWVRIVTEEIKYDFDYFAVKLLQGAIARTLDSDPSPANLQKCCETLREFFVHNADQPQIQKDIQKIMTKEAYSGS